MRTDARRTTDRESRSPRRDPRTSMSCRGFAALTRFENAPASPRHRRYTRRRTADFGLVAQRPHPADGRNRGRQQPRPAQGADAVETTRTPRAEQRVTRTRVPCDCSHFEFYAANVANVEAHRPRLRLGEIS